jgi:hypothetical protein
LTVYAGITNGWDNFSDPINSQGIVNPGYINANSNAAFLGGVSFKNSDQTQAFTSTVSSGNEPVAFIGAPVNVGNRSIWSNVYTNELSDKVTYVFQNDNGWQFNANTGLQNQGQWFRDNNGYRVFAPIRNGWVGGPAQGGFQGNFFQATWGLNWKPTRNWIIRPELRYDWYSPDDVAGAKASGALPFGPNFGRLANGGTEFGQFYGGCDAIWQF